MGALRLEARGRIGKTISPIQAEAVSGTGPNLWRKSGMMAVGLAGKGNSASPIENDFYCFAARRPNAEIHTPSGR